MGDYIAGGWNHVTDVGRIRWLAIAWACVNIPGCYVGIENYLAKAEYQYWFFNLLYVLVYKLYKATEYHQNKSVCSACVYTT